MNKDVHEGRFFFLVFVCVVAVQAMEAVHVLDGKSAKGSKKMRKGNNMEVVLPLLFASDEYFSFAMVVFYFSLVSPDRLCSQSYSRFVRRRRRSWKSTVPEHAISQAETHLNIAVLVYQNMNGHVRVIATLQAHKYMRE